MKLFAIISTLFFIQIVSTFSQEKTVKNVKTLNDNPTEFINEITAGVTTNTNSSLIGGFSFKYLRQQNDKWFHAAGIELVNVKNHKEEKFSSPNTGNNFIPGKINHLYSLRLLYGGERLLFGKYPEDGIRVSAYAMGGLTLGLAKPYFIEYNFSPGNNPDYQIVQYDPDIHNLSQIQGKAGFFYGMGETKIYPGISLKTALNFELSAGELLQTVSGIEVGFNIEYFPKQVPVFLVGNKSTYTSLFLILYIGQRY